MKLFRFTSGLIFILFFTAWLQPVKGQSFSFVPDNATVYDAPGSEIIIHVPIINTSSDTIIIYVLRTQNDLPADWSSSFCFDGLCFAPFVDSAASDPISPGDTVDFSLDVYTDTIPGTATFRIVAKNIANPSDSIAVVLVASTDLSSIKNSGQVVKTFSLFQNYPNPFNPTTTISFELINRSFTTLKIFDILGRDVASIINKELESGYHEYNFSATDFKLHSGVYYYQLTAGSYQETKKMMVLQ